MNVLRITAAVAGVFALGLANTAQASDIGGEIEPPPCDFGAGCSLLSGVPACNGPMTISLFSGLGSVLANTSAYGDSAATAWLVNQHVASGAASLLFAGGFGPAVPFSPDLDTPGNPTG